MKHEYQSTFKAIAEPLFSGEATYSAGPITKIGGEERLFPLLIDDLWLAARCQGGRHKVPIVREGARGICLTSSYRYEARSALGRARVTGCRWATRQVDDEPKKSLEFESSSSPCLNAFPYTEVMTLLYERAPLR